MSGVIRPARRADAAAMVEIYAPVVRNSPTSFELEPPTEEEFAERLRERGAVVPWLVYEEAGRVLGYAYGAQFRARAAYAWSAETSVYVHADAQGRGVGRRLMVVLLEALRLQGFHQVIAGVTLPNEASVRLHEKLGFRAVGVFREVGRKYDAWHDVGFWELTLPGDRSGRSTPLAPEELYALDEWARVVRGG